MVPSWYCCRMASAHSSRPAKAQQTSNCELSTSPIDKLKENVEYLRHSMESLPGFDVPFIAEVETGNNWHNMSKNNG